MDRDLIKQLIEALAASDLAELEYRSNGETLRLVKRAAAGSEPEPSVSPHLVAQAAIPVPASPPSAKPDAVMPRTIVAPLYGIVHLQEAPGAPPLVVPGQSVAARQVVCVIEAMKAFNQVRAECDCVIASVLVESGQEVEAGQTLFALR